MIVMMTSPATVPTNDDVLLANYEAGCQVTAEATFRAALADAIEHDRRSGRQAAQTLIEDLNLYPAVSREFRQRCSDELWAAQLVEAPD